MSENYCISIDSVKKEFVNHLVRNLLFDVIILLIGFANGLFSNPKTQIISLMIMTLFFLYSIFILIWRYRIIFISISKVNGGYLIEYLNFGRKKSQKGNELIAETRVSLSNYSTKTILPVKVILSIDGKVLSFRLSLKNAILLFAFIEGNGGSIKNSFELNSSLKELRSNKEYEDIYSSIDKLIK